MITKTSIKLNCINSKPGWKDKVLEWTKGNICVNEGGGEEGKELTVELKLQKLMQNCFIRKKRNFKNKLSIGLIIKHE